MLDKGLIFNVNISTSYNPTAKYSTDETRANDISCHFCEKYAQMGTSYVKLCSILLIREMYIKAMVSYYFTAIIIVITKNQKDKCPWR